MITEYRKKKFKCYLYCFAASIKKGVRQRMLDRQINLFRLDTDAFLYPEEQAEADKKSEAVRVYNELKENLNKDDENYEQLKAEGKTALNKAYSEYTSFIKKSANKYIDHNKQHPDKKSIRQLDRNKLYYIDTKTGEERVNVRRVISMFESTLSRSLGIKQDELTYDIFVVEVYYYDIGKDLILNGFDYNGNHYIYFSSSAGQIRTKKTVFVREDKYEKIRNKIMCGLTINHINELGGMNINKLLAYTALANSATDLWEDVLGQPFDIDKCIVVDDFETLVHDKVDNIDIETYKITKGVEMDVPIPHTDGCGMVLPKVSTKNFMIRMPWFKGLLGVWDYEKFCLKTGHSIVKDIWGKEYDVIKDDIQIIFTKSQFKMYQFYSSWDQYKENFKKYKCEIGICNIEEDKIPNAQINYQMLQTLHDMSDDEILKLCEPANNKIKSLSNSLESILRFYRTPIDREEKEEQVSSYFSKALGIYPELLSDSATQRDIKDKRNSLVKQYKSGKLDVRGKFTFVLPDLYAFCEWLFLGIAVPQGLIENHEVYCRLYPYSEELDCLRSPHLYIEHSVNKNVHGKTRRGQSLDDWFITDAVYISTKSVMSRILQLDDH